MGVGEMAETCLAISSASSYAEKPGYKRIGPEPLGPHLMRGGLIVKVTKVVRIIAMSDGSHGFQLCLNSFTCARTVSPSVSRL
jgi:hypothetical protein